MSIIAYSFMCNITHYVIISKYPNDLIKHSCCFLQGWRGGRSAWTSLPTSSLTRLPLVLREESSLQPGPSHTTHLNSCPAWKCDMVSTFWSLMVTILSPTSSRPSLAPPTETLMISRGVPPSTSAPPLSLRRVTQVLRISDLYLNPQAASTPSLSSSTGVRTSLHPPGLNKY